MRFASVARWAVFLTVLGWAGYTTVDAGWTYFAIQELVDSVLRETSMRYRTALSTGTQTDEVAAHIRSAIALNAQHDGLSVRDADVQAAASAATVSATVRWGHPILSLGSRDILVIPLTVQGSFVATP